MKKFALLSLLFIVFIFTGCKREDDALWKSLNNSFMAVNSNTFAKKEKVAVLDPF